jgi:hypothetical protein
MHTLASALLVIGAFPAALLSAQSLSQRVAAVGTGTVHLSFASRPGICGDGAHGIRVLDANDEWVGDCQYQPARVALEVQDGTVTDVRVYVGGRWRADQAAADFGVVRPQEAAAYFISLAEKSDDISGDVLLPATIADSVTIWPALLRIARRQDVPAGTRRSAIFWLGQAASSAAAGALDSIVGDKSGDREIRKQAVFALSQHSGDAGVSALLRIARSNADPEIRKTALFWLGQSEDPRALDLFEEILR